MLLSVTGSTVGGGKRDPLGGCDRTAFMATTIPQGNPPASTTDGPVERREHPQFLGMLRGEIFKLVRQRFNWLTTLGFAGVITVYYLFALGNAGIKEFLRQQP